MNHAKMMTTILFATTITLGSLAPAAHAEGGARGVFRDAELFVGAVARYQRELRVDDATLDEMRAIVRSSRDAEVELRQAVSDAHDRLHVLLDADELDADAINAALDAVSDAELELAHHRMRALIAVRGMLTVEQTIELRRLLTAAGGVERPRVPTRPDVPVGGSRPRR